MDGEAKKTNRGKAILKKKKRRQLWDYSVRKKKSCAQYVAMN